MDVVFLAVAGFLLGSFFFTAYYTTKYEPGVRPGYLVVGGGIVISVIVNTWIDFIRDQSLWFRSAILLSYAFIAAGLVMIARDRRRRRR
jgi:hypothetical protein